MWINLPKAHKMDPPAYNDIASSAIPTAEARPPRAASAVPRRAASSSPSSSCRRRRADTRLRRGPPARARSERNDTPTTPRIVHRTSGWFALERRSAETNDDVGVTDRCSASAAPR